jgi:hypothetical protein
LRSILSACCAALLLLPAAARAQESIPAADSVPQAPPEKGKSHYENRVYFGMWTLHLRDQVMALHNNWAVGLTTHGFFGATFLNSYNRRAYTGGLQRTLFATEPRPINASLGLRLGFVTGYDGRLMRLARKTPVLPLVQPFFMLEVEHVGFELQYTWVVMSVAVSYRF